MIPTLIAIAIVFFLGTTALMVWFIGCNEKAHWRHILSALFCWLAVALALVVFVCRAIQSAFNHLS